jgi:[ribosomal protein S5]-alanine N-acetyltransferase
MSSTMDTRPHTRVADSTELAPAPTTFSLRRLHAERLLDAHLPVLRRIHGRAQTMAGLGGVRTAAESVLALQRHLAHWDRHGFGMYVLREVATGRVVGVTGLRHIPIEGMDEVELRCALFPEHWGQGLGTEAARACVTIGRDWVGLSSVVGLVGRDDTVPQRMLEKAGLVFEREVTLGRAPRLLYRTD